MNLGTYLNRRKGELLLVLITAWAVSVVAMNGFYLDELVNLYGYWPRAIVALVADAILILTLYVGAYHRQRKVFAVTIFVIVSAVLVGIAMAMSTGEDIYLDQEGNYLYLALDLIVVSLVCFLLSRTLMGSMAWFVVAAFTCSLAQAFFVGEDLAMSLVAVASGLALISYRNYRIGVEGAQVAKKSSGAVAFLTAVIPALLALGIAAVMWFLVIAPLQPGVLDIKLFTDYRQLPIEEYVGTAEERPLLNYDMTSKNTVDGDPYTTDDLKEDVAAEYTVDAASALQQQAMVNAAGSGSGASAGGGTKQAFSNDSSEQIYNPISYDSEFPWVTVWIFVVLAVILLLVAFFLIRRWLRMKRLRTMLALPPLEAVKEMYRFSLARMERIGFAQPAGMSLEEFAKTSARQMDTFTEETKVPFQKMTQVYVAGVYGGIEPTEEDLVLFTAFYLRFWKAARAHLGNLKYFFTSFRL